MPRRPSTRMKAGGLVILAAASIQLAACNKKEEPAGQVVATVNGTEITTSELQAEAEALQADLRQPAVRQQILELVIQRQLQAAAAKERGLDKDPRFLAQRRRAEQHILAQMYLMATGAGADDVDMRQARSFIMRNPALFDERQVLVVDRLGFAPARALSKSEVAAVTTMDDAERLLLAKGIRFERRSAVVDPTDVPPKVADNLVKMKDGTVFYDSQGDNGMFGAILERRPEPVPVPEQLSKASAILKRQKQQETVEAALADLRKRAKISYQKGYGPAGASAKPR